MVDSAQMTATEVWNVALAVIASLGGGGLIVAALSSWLGKVWANRLMERERAQYAADLERLKSSLESSNRQLQAELEKTVFVTRVHFETEFKALADIWRLLARVRAAMSQLRPRGDVLHEGETRESRLNERFSEYAAAVESFVAAADGQSPFYPQEIFNHLDALIVIAKREGTDVQTSHDTFKGEWFARGERNFAEFKAGVDAVSDMIRERISKLSVYTGS